ncbi:MAG: PEP-CTERM sorting domain-containing protein [Cyanobacteria bacterium P01_H01_bin.35]
MLTLRFIQTRPNAHPLVVSVDTISFTDDSITITTPFMPFRNDVRTLNFEIETTAVESTPEPGSILALLGLGLGGLVTRKKAK